MNSFFNSSNLVKLILRWKIHLSVIVVATIGLAILFSSPLFIKPKYKSFAVVYPSNLIPYSEETPTEQMLQLFKSEDLSLELIKKFNLAAHYNIDTNSSKYLSLLRDEVGDNVSVRKTEFESIVIESYDNDPKMAYDIVLEIINLFNMKARSLQRDKTAEVVKIFEAQLQYKQYQIDSVQEILKMLRKDYDIYDFNIQLKEYTRGYLYAVNNGRTNPAVYDSMFSKLGEHGGEYLFLGGYVASLASAYNDIKTEYDKALSDLTKVLTYTNVVTQPVMADEKSYPIRWLIVLISTLSTFLLSLIVISFIEHYRKKKKETPAPVKQEN